MLVNFKNKARDVLGFPPALGSVMNRYSIEYQRN
nr:MAG TPA: hypothetical protein [Caudoviricetes sp.]DAN71841.1 MAG TPA: hypothetical protein [Caudoviricetes sp.]